MGHDKDVLETYRVKECGENPCANLPCQNGATCQPIFDEDLCNGHECKKSPMKKCRGKNCGRKLGKGFVCKGSHCAPMKQRRSRKNSRKRCAGANCDFDYDLEYDDNFTDNYGPSYAVEKYEVHDYKCICSPQFTGRHCEESLDPCIGEPCQHGATCDILPQGGYVCKCPPGRTGEHCETRK